MALTPRRRAYAPRSAQFLTLALDENAPMGRRLVMRAPLTSVDGGPQGDLTVGVAAATGSAKGALRLAGQLGGTAEAPDVRGLRTTSGSGTLLAMGALADGEALVRSGTSLVGSPSGSSAVSTHVAASDPHAQYQLEAGRDAAGVYAGLDDDSVVNRPVKAIRAAASGDPGGAASGEAWITGPDLKFQDGQATSVTQTAERRAMKGVAYGYAALDAGGKVVQAPAVHAASHAPGAADALPVDQASGTGSLRTLGTGSAQACAGNDSRLSDARAPTAHASAHAPGGADALAVDQSAGTGSLRTLGSGSTQACAGNDGRLSDARAPTAHKSSHISGGDALSPADIGAAPGGRAIATGAGLSGGGDLTADRTISISAFSGLVSHDVDPGSLSWNASEVKVHATYDVGAEGQLIPAGVRLPPNVNSDLRNEVVLEFDDASAKIITNPSTTLNLDVDGPGLAFALMGDLNSAAAANGRRVRKIILRTRNNNNANGVSSVDIGIFRVRAFATPRGGGSAL